MNSSATAEKILFLGVMLLLAVLSSNFSPPRAGNGAGESVPPGVEPAVPRFSAASVPSPPAPAESPRSIPALSPNPAFRRSGTAAAPEINSAAGLLADLRTGEIYFFENINRRWPMASITKLTTAALAAERLNAADKITLLPRDFLAQGGDLNTALKAGDSFSVQDLVRAMLTFSSNEAAEALSGTYGREAFISGMNGLARDWSLEETHFSDPTGLFAANQSTPLDLLRLAQKIYGEYPQLLAITRAPEATLIEQGSGRGETIKNINLFAGRNDFLGGKTGYTDEASGNLLSIFSYQNRPLVIVILGAADRFGETEKLINWFRENYSV